ncbi:MAG: rRNA pseudouridine synthase [Calditrichaceae bacterium]|nr:rRNA pseudouridine synthase [Calditrichaceae bacterium]RQV97557.1 MAG: rRNA pseudouridine synthase [Calditrichota bacterium]
MMRLNKYLAHAGVASRRKCDDLILAGKVYVNGEKVTRVGIVIDEKNDKVSVNGDKITLHKDYIYVLLNKPRGVVTTASDEFNRSTVVDLVSIPERIYPVGRLDYETAGVLLLTNDGNLANFLIHPNFKVAKIYRALLNKVIRPIDLHKLRNGVELDGEKTMPCKINEIRIFDNSSLLEIEIKEGRYRQIRRMFELFHYKVEELERIEFAGLTCKGLQPGEWRYLNDKEISRLQRGYNDGH